MIRWNILPRYTWYLRLKSIMYRLTSKQNSSNQVDITFTYLPFFVTIISFVSWWKLLQSSASSSITRTHSRLSLEVSLFSCSGLPGLEGTSAFGLTSGDLRGLVLLPSNMDAIEKSDFISALPLLICYHTLHSISCSVDWWCMWSSLPAQNDEYQRIQTGNDVTALCLSILLRT